MLNRREAVTAFLASLGLPFAAKALPKTKPGRVSIPADRRCQHRFPVSGPLGREWAPVVDFRSSDSAFIVTPTPAYPVSQDSLLNVFVCWESPRASEFFGVEVVVLKQGRYTLQSAVCSFGNVSFCMAAPPPGCWLNFYLRSVSCEGRRNTIVDGITPSFEYTVPFHTPAAR